MQTKDIESLLVWAYRDQKVSELIGRGVGLHAIERAADGMAVYSASGDGCAFVERGALLGCRVDGGGAGMALQIHSDAEIIHDAVLALPSKVQRGLVIKYAKLGDRPDWMPGARPRMEPKLVKKGRRQGQPERMYDRHGDVVGHMITIGLTQDLIDARRDLYTVWRDALAGLLRALDGCLRSWQVSGVLPPVAPWLVAA